MEKKSCYALVHALEKIAAARETYEQFAACFTPHDMASTLTICFLHYCILVLALSYSPGR